MIEQNKNLKELNTFMVSATAKYFTVAQDKNSLSKILASDEWIQSEKHLVLGGGSNILFVEDYDGFVLKNEIKGIDITAEDEDSITVRVGAGENWHETVMWFVEQGYWGLENLSYIPGSVGASPVQNIGAYGVEVRSVIESVEGFILEGGTLFKLQAGDCDFDYRSSIFKKNPGKYLITHVTFRLKKQSEPMLDYGRVKEALEQKRVENPTPQDIAEVIIQIRKSKLPEVGEIGTAGSFFKNPIISQEIFESIQEKFPEVKYFDLENGKVKIPAGWLLEELGYRGFQDGHVGNYEKHALIIVHDGKGTGAEVYQHVQNIIQKVEEVFGIELEPEVNIIK